MNVTEQVRRNGFKGEFYHLTPFEILHALIIDNKAETLLKIQQYDLLRHFTRRASAHMEKYWSSIHIAIRNDYFIEDGSMWCDYIDLLHYCGKDINSPKYVCPDNLKIQHDRLEQKRQKALQDENRYNEMKSKFFGIAFSDVKLRCVYWRVYTSL